MFKHVVLSPAAFSTAFLCQCSAQEVSRIGYTAGIEINLRTSRLTAASTGCGFSSESALQAPCSFRRRSASKTLCDISSSHGGRDTLMKPVNGSQYQGTKPSWTGTLLSRNHSESFLLNRPEQVYRTPGHATDWIPTDLDETGRIGIVSASYFFV